MNTKMVFHGSDIEKICDYYHLNKEDIVKFGANVNPLGLLSITPAERLLRISEHLWMLLYRVRLVVCR